MKGKETMPRRMIHFLILLALIGFVSALPVKADSTDSLKVEQMAVTPKLPAVFLTENSYIELKEAHQSQSELGQVISFSVVFYNGEEVDQYFNDYWIRLKTKSGLLYTIQMLFQDKSHNRILPKTKAEFTFYAIVDEFTTIQDLVFQFIKWDLNELGFAKVLGEISVPEDYKTITPVRFKRIILVNNTALKTSVTKMSLNSPIDPQEKQQFVKINFELENRGGNTIAFPKYEFLLKTDTGLTYPLEILESKELDSIRPRDLKKIELNARVPLSISLKNSTLMLTNPVTPDSNNKLMLPVSSYEIPVAESELAVDGIISNEHRIIQIDDQLVNTSINDVFLKDDNKLTTVIVFYQMTSLSEMPLEIPDYRFFIRTRNGALYHMELANMGASKTLPSGEMKEFQITGTIPKSIKLDYWEFIVTKPSVDEKFNIPVVIYELPSASNRTSTTFDFTTVTPINGLRKIEMENRFVNTTVNRVFLRKDDKFTTVTIYYQMTNLAEILVTVPSYQYFIQTQSGAQYPLELKTSASSNSLPSQDNKEFQLTGEIPKSVKLEGWKLVVTKQSEDGKSDLPVAAYELQNANNDLANRSKEFEFTAKSGNFIGKLNYIRRIPWEDQDILTAEVWIANKNNTTLVLPQLSGYFLLNGVVKVDVKMIQVNKMLSLNERLGANFQFIGKLPAEYEIGELKFMIQEKRANENTTTDLLEFYYAEDINFMPLIKLGDQFLVEDTGRKTAVSIRSLNTYVGETENILEAQVDLENLEKQFKQTIQLTGSFKTKDGVLFAAKVQKSNKKIIPGGKETLSIWTSVPQEYDLSDVKLLLGEGVTGDQVTESQGTADAYFHVNQFELPAVSLNLSPSTDFKNINFFPYALDIHAIRMEIATGMNSVTLDMKYKLTKNMQYQANMEGHSLLIEYEDGNATFSQEFALESGGTSALKLGAEQTIHIQKTDADLYRKFSMSAYKLNIYDQFQDSKRLLATRTLRWFNTEQ